MIDTDRFDITWVRFYGKHPCLEILRAWSCTMLQFYEKRIAVYCRCAGGVPASQGKFHLRTSISDRPALTNLSQKPCYLGTALDDMNF